VTSGYQRGAEFIMPNEFLEIQSVSKSYSKREVLKNLSLSIRRGEFLTLLGESGSGKTTLLRILAGFEEIDHGRILLDGDELSHQPSYRRPINTVFQSYALFPHMNVFENVAYGLRVRKTSSDSIALKVRKALGMVKMSDFETAVPTRLSGGQQQRIALARALVNEPKILLLDEPLSALDANLRQQMQSELKKLQRGLGITFLFVTHDQSEALALSDRIALLRDGELEQIASPAEIYNAPATSYVARFIGHSNVLRCQINVGSCHWGQIQWEVAKTLGSGSRSFSLRPENIHMGTAPNSANIVSFDGEITHQSFEGAHMLLEVQAAGGSLRVQVPGSTVASGRTRFYFDPLDAVALRD
jgi:spermidine/putrescine transport system ATP-binding protein